MQQRHTSKEKTVEVCTDELPSRQKKGEYSAEYSPSLSFFRLAAGAYSTIFNLAAHQGVMAGRMVRVQMTTHAVSGISSVS
jgi:hypothetical protein